MIELLHVLAIAGEALFLGFVTAMLVALFLIRLGALRLNERGARLLVTLLSYVGNVDIRSDAYRRIRRGPTTAH